MLVKYFDSVRNFFYYSVRRGNYYLEGRGYSLFPVSRGKEGSPLLVENPEGLIVSEVERFIARNPGNRDAMFAGIHYFENPLVGFADARDPLFTAFKDIIGPFHLTPLEALDCLFPDRGGRWEGASVISWILPIAAPVRESNRRELRTSSQPWLRTKTRGEELNVKLAEHMASFIQEHGFVAGVPTLSPFYEVVDTAHSGFAANWSERHVAFVCGLGTFSLGGALITERGVAMRCGSLVTGLPLRPTHRHYSDFREYCLFYSAGTCGKCIERCPGGAISQGGHDKERCMEHCANVAGESGGGTPGCGLCQTAVPCEARIPGKRGDRNRT